ncbi:MAG: thiS [Variovorax sp.]|nr:thiS [Variovorax sp.]
MNILINDHPSELQEGATLADAIAQARPRPPYAAAVNKAFVPRTAYVTTPLAEGDRIELIAPVTGG